MGLKLYFLLCFYCAFEHAESEFSTRRPPPGRTQNHRNSYTKPAQNEKKPDFSKMENWMFGSLVLIGLFAIILSIRDLYCNEIEDLNAFTGIVFALLFTFLLLYSWTQIFRKKE